MRDLRVQHKLAIGFTGLTLVMTMLTIFLLLQMGIQHRNMQKIVSYDVRKMELSGDIQFAATENTTNLLDLLNRPEEQEALRASIAANRAAVSEKLKSLESLVYTAQGKQLLADIHRTRGEYIAAYDKAIALHNVGDMDGAEREVQTRVLPLRRAYTEAIEVIKRQQRDLIAAGTKEAQQAYDTSRTTGWSLLAIAIVLAVFLTVYITRLIVRPLSTLQASIEHVRHTHDLTGRAGVQGRDEVATTAQAFDALLVTWQGTLRDVAQRTAGVEQLGRNLESIASQVAGAVEQQNGATASAAAAVEESTVSISHVADRTRDGETLATDSTRLARHGAEQVQSVVDKIIAISGSVAHASTTIESVDQQVQAISSIVTLIKEVADQTNLLALNAAIEAARAGEAGRGFAVVADEVRKLAERTTNATREIGEKINAVTGGARDAVAGMGNVVTLVDSGVEQARGVHERIEAIRESVQQMSSLVGDINMSMKEQSTASNEIAQNVEQVARMTEQNASASTSAADAARRLVKLADELRESVGRFRFA
ncbi:methyl-accepting chemotaxis protein [Chitiniphilus purpureus]|uniref:Methyl-accepting chemotaxis protein n=1 Tax=Chitiniphilus purpureus TaxID=2981137 RepID=A0ABY6DP13_9NEIS|nr:methyl-accepting chemotaxis protein [Chitiniphilus sp. CD1]UXY15767.1 methyl-accepting chemotaxis protein [Chitiniphilus sp. CD1]